MRTAFALSVLLGINCSTNQAPPTSQCSEEFCVWQDPHPATIPAIRYNPDDPWFPVQQLHIASGHQPVFIYRINLQVGEVWGGFRYDTVRITRADQAANRDDPRETGPWLAEPLNPAVAARMDREMESTVPHASYVTFRELTRPLYLPAHESGEYTLWLAMHPQLNPTWHRPELPHNTFRLGLVSLESMSGFRNCTPLNNANHCWLYGPYLNVTW